MHRTLKRWLTLLLAFVPILAACSVSLPQGESGSIAMMPFFDAQRGIRGVAPAECSRTESGYFDCSKLTPALSKVPLSQETFVGTEAELVAVLSESVDTDEETEPSGSYQGSHYTWETHSLEAAVPLLGPETYRIYIGIAVEGSGSRQTWRIVSLAATSTDFDENEALLDAVFTRAMYAMAPLEDGAKG